MKKILKFASYGLIGLLAVPSFSKPKATSSQLKSLLTTSQLLTGFADQTVAVDGELYLPFRVMNPDGPIRNLEIFAAPFDLKLFPIDQILFLGAGEFRYLKITPAKGLSGVSRINILAYEKDRKHVYQTSFTIKVENASLVAPRAR